MSIPGMDVWLWKGRYIEDLPRGELLAALRQALERIRKLQERPIDYRAMAITKLRSMRPK